MMKQLIDVIMGHEWHTGGVGKQVIFINVLGISQIKTRYIEMHGRRFMLVERKFVSCASFFPSDLR
jgi:hypothetical protein